MDNSYSNEETNFVLFWKGGLIPKVGEPYQCEKRKESKKEQRKRKREKERDSHLYGVLSEPERGPIIYIDI